MKKPAEILRPKFEAILQVMDQELSGLGIASWTKPNGGYFISFDAMEGCAKKIVAKAKEAGLTMTGAGATYPYHNDPQDPTSVLHRPSRHRKSWKSQVRYSC